MPKICRYWAVLRLQSIAPVTVVEYRDQETAAPRMLSAPGLPIPALPGVQWIQGALGALSNRYIPRMGRAPVFLDAPDDLDEWDLERFFGEATGPRLPSRLSKAPWMSRADVTLPLRVVAAGPNADAWFEELRNEGWTQDPAFQQYGLNLHATDQDAVPLLHAVQPHVVVTTAPQTVLTAAAKMTEEARPRLVVWLDDTFTTAAPMAAPDDVSGVALLRVGNPKGGPGGLVRDVFLNFAHDLPLHEIAEQLAYGGPRIRLTADPCSVQSLRLHAALGQIRREAQKWETLFQALPADSPLQSWINRTRHIQDFLGESHAFVPMARLRASMASALATAPNIFRSETPSPGAPSFRAAAEEATAGTDRAAHVAIERLDTQPYFEPVTPTTSLAADMSYQLRLHIGSPLSDSLVERPVAIDPGLGPPDDSDGYNLEVAIQGKAFTVESDRVVKLRLPLAGNSDPVYFEVRTPAALGQKELRVCIYHRNYLVQSLLLEALIEAAEGTHPDRVTTVKVETTQAPNFSAVDQLGERALSIGMNAGEEGKTHDFVLKSDGSSHELSLPGTTFQKTHDEIRKQLDAAARDPNAPALPYNYPKIHRGSPAPADVAGWIRAFAVWGHKLYDAFFDRIAQPGSPLRPHIVGLQGTSGQRIQVFRFKYEDAFLWTLLYDWDIPSDTTAPVCLGWLLDAHGQAVPCAHHATSGEYCVRGFWGVRHRVEELLPGTPAKNVSSPTGDKPVRLVADATLPESALLTTDLTTDLGAAALAAGPVQPALLLDLLFKTTTTRPALLILLGHHERQLLPGGLGQSRIKIDSAPAWLSEADVRSRAQKETVAWSQPRSAVVMMACASSTTGAETLTDFTTAWNACGASAIVGTECVIGPQLAAEFARLFAMRAWKDKTNLGDVMAEIRADLLAEGNPLAFLFHAVGDIDLVLQ
jgi:hypothetical protein